MSFEAALWHGDGRYLLIYKVDYFKIILNSLYVIALMDSLLNSSVNLLIIHVISDLFKKITFTALVKIKFITKSGFQNLVGEMEYYLIIFTSFFSNMILKYGECKFDKFKRN